LAEPLKETPPIVLAVCKIVAVEALPLKFPLNPPLAVTFPVMFSTVPSNVRLASALPDVESIEVIILLFEEFVTEYPGGRPVNALPSPLNEPLNEPLAVSCPVVSE
jgi:hypothetical protein